MVVLATSAVFNSDLCLTTYPALFIFSQGLLSTMCVVLMMTVLSFQLLVTKEVTPPATRVMHLFSRPGACRLPHFLQKKSKLWIIHRGKMHHLSTSLLESTSKNVFLCLAGFSDSTTNKAVFLTPLSSKLSNSSLILRSWRPYFLAAHKAGGADLDLPLNGAPSVGVPASSSPLAWSSSSLETVDAWDSELTLIRPATETTERRQSEKDRNGLNKDLGV